MVVVLALMAILAAFAVPKLVSGTTLGADQHAKTTASGAADTIVSTYANAVTSQYWDTGLLQDQIATAEASLGRDLTPAELSALPRPPRTPDVSTTSLQSANPDIKFVDATIASPGPDATSVGETLHNAADPANAYWVVGVAVNLNPPGQTGTGSCWIAQLALNPPQPTRTETYLLFDFTNNDPTSTTPNQPDADQCTGAVAANLDVGATTDPAAGSVTTPAPGTAWSTPLQASATQVTDAASAASPAS